MQIQQEWVWQPWNPERQLNPPQRGPRRRWQWLTGRGSARWKQQVPGREWHSARCCPVSCKKHKLRVGIKQCPSIQEQCDTGAEASISRGLSGPLMATPYSWIHESHHHYPSYCLYTSKVFLPPLPPTPWNARQERIVPQLSTSLCPQSHPRRFLHLKAICPSASEQECHPFPKQQPLLTPSTPVRGILCSAGAALGIPEGFPHKAAAGSDSSVTRHRGWCLPSASSALLTETSSLPSDWLLLALDPLFVQWMSQLMTVTAAWKLPDFSLCLPTHPHCSDHSPALARLPKPPLIPLLLLQSLAGSLQPSLLQGILKTSQFGCEAQHPRAAQLRCAKPQARAGAILNQAGFFFFFPSFL